jgi:hypothetical protein
VIDIKKDIRKKSFKYINMSFLNALLGKNEDDRLFDEFLKANQEMNGPKAKECLDNMTDEGLFKATFKVDELAKKDPGYMILNTLLFSAFANRPHLENPFS